jgi:hypothetical protein
MTSGTVLTIPYILPNLYYARPERLVRNKYPILLGALISYGHY